jgi:hypothetical protein
MAATTSAISKLSELASQLGKSVSGFTLPDHGGGTGVLTQARIEATLRGATQNLGPDEVSQLAERRRSLG